MDQKVGMFATLSILAALGSYFLVCSGNPGWGLAAAIASIPLGLAGLLRAASPRVRGGLISIGAIVLGVIGVILSILGLFFGLFAELL